MCIFTRPVEAVSDTRIFARPAGPGRQYLAYEMSFGALEDTAMVLPLPVASHDEHTALRFVDLSASPDFFDRLGKMIVMFEELEFGSGGIGVDTLSLGGTEIRAPLLVHEVGAFDASFVPSIADFDRLDKRFQLSPELWSALPQYQDYGFAVFRLRATNGQAQHAHPMAFEFSTRFDNRLFIPTVHVHDGSVARLAWFDHMIYAQSIRWPAAQEGHYDGGIRGEGERKKVLAGAWSGLRERGDWRYRRDTEGDHEKGIILCGRPADPLSDFKYQDAPAEAVLQQWRTVSAPARAQILRLVRDERALASGEKTPPEVRQALFEATPEQRKGWAHIHRWMELRSLLRLKAPTFELWQQLNETDRARALRGEPPESDSPAARAWLEIIDAERKNFGKLYRWQGASTLVETFGQQIVEWMALPVAWQDITQRVAALKNVFSVFERVPDLAKKYYGHGGGVEVRRQIVNELLAAESGEEEGTRLFLDQSDAKYWGMLPGLDRLEEMSPLFDAAQKLYGLGLSGMLANEDVFLDSA